MKQLTTTCLLFTVILFLSCSGPSENQNGAGKNQDSTGTKTDLKLGFIKLTDMAPLAVAKEKGYFKDEGLNVTLEAQANWKVLLDRVIDGQLDGAHMLAGQPLGATIGIGTKADIVTGCVLDLNGNAITVSKSVWEEMKKHIKYEDGNPVHPITADALLPVINSYNSKSMQLKFGMVFPLSTHNYELRYWLAAANIHPGMYTDAGSTGTANAQVLLSVTPPPQMPATLEAGTIQGYCVGEPWNQQAVFKNIGVPVTVNSEIWNNCPEKVFGTTRAWAEKYPKTHVALVKAIIRACIWLDNPENRKEAARILSKSEYVGADYEVIAASMTGTFEFEKGDKRQLPDFNVFFRYNATYPYYSDAVWFLTQMRRWGQINQSQSDTWYHDQAAKVFLPEVWKQAAKALVHDGYLKESDIPQTDGYKPATSEFIDHKIYDGKKPNDYLKQFTIGNKN